MLHNKLKGMEHRAPCKHVFSPYIHPQPVGWIKGKKNISECGHVAYQIKGQEVWTNIEANSLTLHTCTPDLQVKLKSDFEIVQISLFH